MIELESDKQFFILKTLNFLSSRPFFFIVPVGKKEFTNPFFKFLDFPGKNIKIF